MRTELDGFAGRYVSTLHTRAGGRAGNLKSLVINCRRLLSTSKVSSSQPAPYGI